MNTWQKALLTTIGAILIVSSVCLLDAPAQESGIVRLSGSRYMYFSITDMARLYADRKPESKVIVTDSEIRSALPDLLKKKSDAIMVLGGLDDDAKSEAKEAGIQLHEYVVGWGGVVLLTDPTNPVKELTLEQVRKIFLGQIQNWKEVGGLDEPIVTMSRDESVSGTEEFFRQTVLEGMPMSQQTVRVLDHNIVNAVWKRKGAIADARFSEAIRGKIQGKVSIIGLKENEDSPAVLPSAETIRNRSYPISAPLVLYYDNTSSSTALRDFAAFCSRRGLGEIYAGSKSSEIR